MVEKPDAGMELAQALGRRVQRLRESRGWRQVDLAEHAGVIQETTISHIEAGNRFPSAKSLAALAEALEVEVAALFVDADHYELVVRLISCEDPEVIAAVGRVLGVGPSS